MQTKQHPIETAIREGRFPCTVGDYSFSGKVGHYIPTGEPSAEFIFHNDSDDLRIWITASGEVIED